MNNILHLTFNMHIGGTEQVIRNLVETADKLKYRSSVLCLEAPVGPFGVMLQEKGHVIDTMPRKEGFDLGLIFNLRKYLKSHQVDILHCHQYTPWVYGALASMFLGINVIFTEHGRFYPDSSSWKRKVVNPLLLKFTSYITAISKATKQALTKFEYIPENKIKVIYNGITGTSPDCGNCNEIREKSGVPSSALIVGTIARLDPIKNHKMMIESFQKVNQHIPDSYLFIVGDGEERQNLENICSELNVTDRVIFTGYIPDPVKYIQTIDIFLLSSLNEGTSITLLEAMSAGKPCVVTNVGGNPEIIEDGFNGLVTASDNPEDFAHAIQSLVQDETLFLRMKNNAISRFQSNFTVDAMKAHYERIYHR